jgi:hypothetical protein
MTERFTAKSATSLIRSGDKAKQVTVSNMKNPPPGVRLAKTSAAGRAFDGSAHKAAALASDYFKFGDRKCIV